MVLFENINLNQRVEVLRDGVVYSGTVKYKGCLNGVPGDWVGVDLDEPEGVHDGMLNARRYFLCRPRHGIFTTASQIRFIPLKRCLRDRYHTVDRRSEIDPDLFDYSPDHRDRTELDAKRTESWIDSTYRDRATSAKFSDRPVVEDYANRRFPLRHSVSGKMPTAFMLQPDVEKAKCFGASKRSSHSRSSNIAADAEPLHGSCSSSHGSDFDFISAPAIPKPHAPHSVLKRQLRHGSGLHYPRIMTVNTGRDAIKLAQWNDISA